MEFDYRVRLFLRRYLRILLVLATIILMGRWALHNTSSRKDLEPTNKPVKNDVTHRQHSDSDWDDDITPQFLDSLDKRTGKCVNFVDHSKKMHPPFSKGKFRYPFMRPAPKCRTFHSPALELLILDLKSKVKDPDIARLIENCLPNTLDTTILWHKLSDRSKTHKSESGLPETFVVTGDIHAEWLRDSARQLSIFQPLIKYDEGLKDLIKGAINTQLKYIRAAPYCNAFHPPQKSGVKKGSTARDSVFPTPDWSQVFECKYEIDSLASFLTLTNEFLENSDFDMSVITSHWKLAYERVLTVLTRESRPLFDSEHGRALPFYYSFQRNTNIGSETLPLGGVGNPVNYNTGLIRSAFRPSDDATILQFFIPGNVHMLSELKKIKMNVLDKLGNDDRHIEALREATLEFIQNMESGIKQFGIVEHKTWGKVYAYEVDGYGSSVLMDDANIPSLLSLPEMGFTNKNDEIYLNTRRMILSKSGNPYYLKGQFFEGIGGPHIGIQNAWPMSLLVRIRTSDNDTEILECLQYIMETTAGLGLMHESVNVNSRLGLDYTRPWFAWCNSEFGKTILHLAKYKPHLIFKKRFAANPYSIDSIFPLN